MKKRLSGIFALMMAIFLCFSAFAESMEDLISNMPMAASQASSSGSLLDDMREQLVEEDAAREKAEKQKPFDATSLGQFGNCMPYTAVKDADGISYMAYLFEGIDTSLVDFIVAEHTSKHYFSYEERMVFGDDPFHSLTQFGDDGKTVMICSVPNKGYTLVLLEENIPTTGFHFPVECTSCKASGTCARCEGKKICIECDGVGEKRCSSCNTSGNCSVCGGSGLFRGKIDCSGCYGGNCKWCGGSGYGRRIGDGDCFYCNGSGDCRDCAGNGLCKTCNGVGYY